MGVASHLGIETAEYDARIRTFVPHYEEMLTAAATALPLFTRSAPTIVDLGIGSGALSARCLDVLPKARVIGIDIDPGMLDLASRRLGHRIRTIAGDLTTASLPRCDAFVAALSLHHIAQPRKKKQLYRRCFDTLRPGGVLINADRCLAATPQLESRDRANWRSHLEHSYPRKEAGGFLRAWAKEDFYLPLDEEVALLESAGFVVDVAWRRDGFAVVVALKDSRA